MRLTAAEQRYCQSRNSNNKVNFSGKPMYLPENWFMPLSDFNSVHQRAALGAGALAFQPLIDYYNPMVDEKTKKFSVVKTIVKAVVGVTVGCGIRALALWQINKQVGQDGDVDAHKEFIKKIKNKKLAEELSKIKNNKKAMKNFKGSLAAIVGLAALVVADFAIDMPLAKFGIEKTTKAMGLTENKPKGGIE